MDRHRAAAFLEKADTPVPDTVLAALRTMTDAALGIDEGLVRRAMTAFSLPADVRASRSPSQGTFHRLYEVDAPGRRSLLRIAVARGGNEAALMDLECRTVNALRALRLAVPACAFRALEDDGEVRGAHLMEAAQGESLTALDADETRMQRALGWVGAFLAALHGMQGAGFGPLSLARWDDRRFHGVHSTWTAYVQVRLDEHVHDCRRIGAIDEGESRAIVDLFDRARPGISDVPSALLHGDPGSHNFLVDGAGIRAVIDWEDALLGDPLFDVASLCTFHPERRHAAVFGGYGIALQPGSAEWTRFWLYFLRIALAKTVHRHRFGYGDRPDRVPASRRIQLALERLGGVAA